MSFALALTLLGLALVDSTSFGTIGVPLFLTVARTPVRKVLLYLGTITAFYFVVGTVLVLGLDSTIDAFGKVFETSAATAAQFVVGVVLLVVAFRIDPKRAEETPRRSWQPKNSSTGAIMALALTAGLIELASMVPYIAAIGILTSSGLPVVERLGILALDNAIMAIPALGLRGLARTAGPRVDGLLDRLGSWIQKYTGEMVGWVLGIVGFFLATSAFSSLFLS